MFPDRLYDALGYAEWSTAGHRLAFVGTMAIVVGVAALSYYTVERPSRQRLRNRMGVIAAHAS